MLFLASLSSCLSPPLPSYPAKEDIADRFLSESLILTQSSYDNDVRFEDLKDVYMCIDGSYSMQGYLGRGGVSADQFEFIPLIKRTAMTVSEVTKPIFLRFGEEIIEAEKAELRNSNQMQKNYSDRLWDRLRDLDFYKQMDTRINELIVFFLEQEPKESLFIVVTDGVQSNRGFDLSGLTIAIRKWLDRGYAMEIIGYRSQFDGNIYIDSIPKGEEGHFIWYSSTRGKEETYRPYYLYVFAPNVRILEELNDRLDFQDALGNVFNPSLSIIEDIVLQENIREGIKGEPLRLKARYDMPTALHYVPLLKMEWFGPKFERKMARCLLQFHYRQSARSSAEIFDFQKQFVKIDSVYFDGSQWVNDFNDKKKPTYWITQSDSLLNEYDKKVDFVLTLPRNHERGWYFYHVTLNLNPISLRPPDWVEKWSTRSEYDFAKTLYLSDLSRVMINEIIKEQYIYQFIISLGVS